MGPIVDHFRQILLWPLELMPVRADEQIQKHWDLLERATPATPWREVEDEFTLDAELFQERHYSEFVTFLPYVQRFLYGENRDRGGASESPIRVFRRADVARARLTFPGQDDPIVLDVVHVDLYFFYDIDVVILVVELSGAGLPLPRVQETLYRLGRAYPTHWESNGQGGHCLPAWSGCPRTAPSWRCRTTRSAKNSCRTSAATARRRSPRTGSSC